MQNHSVARVSFDIPIYRLFDYKMPLEISKNIRIGHRVLVPFGRSTRIGIVLEIAKKSSFGQLKTIISILDPEPVFSNELLYLSKWISSYYFCPEGKVLKVMLPPAVRQNTNETGNIQALLPKGNISGQDIASIQKKAPKQWRLLSALNAHAAKQKEPVPIQEIVKEAGVDRSCVKALEKKGLISIIALKKKSRLFQDTDEYAQVIPHKLTEEQKKAVSVIHNKIEDNKFSVLLLHGITGSGKTEVYLRAIERVLSLGKDALLLVPEISLTPQTISWVYSRFGSLVAIFHSRLSAGERRLEWERVRKGEARIVVGVRSAVFAPLKKLGLIVVDEEQSRAFKQEDAPRYNARDVAIVRGRKCAALVLLGTATPSLETYYNAMNKKYDLLKLTRRIEGSSLPKVHIVDMREEAQWQKGDILFSRRLMNALEQRLRKKEQTILFLNRRGFSPFVTCRKCGYAFGCTECNLTLTYHKKENKCRCHTCGYQLTVPRRCPDCGNSKLSFLGTGTQRVEERIKKLFPGIRSRRMDTDAMNRKDSHKEVLNSFAKGELDVLIGTQMIAKGLDFPQVTLVGVLQADVSLNLPDFRSGEVTFQLLTQVAGRAGRGFSEGEVIIQTHTPKHPAILLAAKQDYEAFYKYEIKLRRELNYPPNSSFIDLRFRGKNENNVASYASRFKSTLSPVPENISFFGPYPAPISRKKGMYEIQIVFSTNKRVLFQKWLKEKLVRFETKRIPGVSVAIDVDPVSMM
ncbi:MAG: primosomal protein N' [Candidatus Theseobacter exili]|nr:primosomal protein N' [Candidatus Theseobacter exili]